MRACGRKVGGVNHSSLRLGVTVDCLMSQDRLWSKRLRLNLSLCVKRETRKYERSRDSRESSDDESRVGRECRNAIERV